MPQENQPQGGQTKLYVGNLPWSTTEEELATHFAQVGTVVSAVIITDRFTGRSRGFGFVEMETPQAAQKAIADLNGSQLNGRSLVVALARPREERKQRWSGRSRTPRR